MRRLRPAAVILSGLLLSTALPALASAAPAARPVEAVSAAAGPGAEGPDLGYANRTGPPPGMPDWSRVGYRGGASLPGDGSVTSDASCRITPAQLASKFKVVADDGIDDTTGLQNAIDDIKSRCTPNASFDRLSLISLPSGRVDVTRQISVDTSFLVLRGQGSGDGGTRMVFRPDTNTRYDTVANGRWDQDSMTAGSGNDVGKGGWIWPGRGMFRVQTRDVADRYVDDRTAAPANRKDLFEGSVNQHWVSGIKVSARSDDPGFSARQGDDVVRLASNAAMSKFSVGGYVWVGAANSVKFYEQQGVTDWSMMENLHMRQQMFRVTSVDSEAKTIRLDRPLEWDLPVDSTSDGSNSLSDTPYTSKVTPLKVVEGVGFEDFAFTQDMIGLPKLGGGTYQLTPEQAKNNYGNMAPEYAMHGIVFKWAANSWARGLKATMTGSHPIVTENARNLQIERNSFDGAWNKGKGGNGYLRGSRVWDSLWAYNLSRNLRHFTFQWSASGNVAFRNDLDSDLNLHGGWEHHNLFEQNTVRIPYEHRSANCQSNCGGEGGEVDEGTWYPIWWAAGPKAVKWSGSSGPQNVFYNNTLIKQTTPGGAFEPYGPYSTDSPGSHVGTAYQFGSENGNPRSFRPLGQGGQAIEDWTGRETLDYAGQGVVPTDVGKRSSLFLRDTGSELDPREDHRRKVVSWNMQGAGSRDTDSYQNKYSVDLPALLRATADPGTASNPADVVLIQEAGSPPASAQPHGVIAHNQIDYFDGLGNPRPVREYRLGTGRGQGGWLYWLHTDTNTASPPGRVNLAIWTRNRVNADDVYVVRPAFMNSNGDYSSRPALGVNVDGVVYFTVHGNSPGGNDDVGLLANIRQRMNTAGLPWVAMGDYNRAPHNGVAGNLTAGLEAFYPNTFRVWAPSTPTHPTTGTGTQRTLDYAVLPAGQGTRVDGIDRVGGMTASDHYPVLIHLGNLPNAPTPPQSTVDQDALGTKVFRNVATTNGAGPSSSTSNVISDQPINQASLPAQQFALTLDPEYPGYYRVMHEADRRYLGQEGGRRDARMVLWPDPAVDQLWAPVPQGDGTWTLQNYWTQQYLTDLGGGQTLVGRDYDGSAGQRWFLETPADALGVNEVALRSPDAGSLVMGLDDLEEGETQLVVEGDADDPDQRFVTIPVGRIDNEECYYLSNGGKYVTSTSDHPYEPRNDSLVKLSTFRIDDDGYLWCATAHGTDGAFLSNRTRDDERMYLTVDEPSDELTVHALRPGIPVTLWEFMSAT
ncbi:endonuclease/exonuclease/phosphatase family protein [Actinacidiphila glaucinigra]|uniref:endonuclease/exonuclease/phosphatase family protein n=1 Tax=Actinacidiphila glaucinigra TaxID=235986 RepID=UPI002E331220|nr:RICIN domain-containing protein [Actinacidiphila glaucinigra]